MISRRSGSKVSLLSMVVLLALIACSQGGGGGGNTDGTLLEGNPASPAGDVMKDYDSGDRTDDDEISADASGVRLDRTKLSISFVSTATVDDINALLLSLDGKIVNMMAGVNIIIIKIPDPGDLAGLEAIIAELENDPLVIDVVRAVMPDTDSLPGNYDEGAIASADTIDHHIAVNAPAAWNAKNALSYAASFSPLLLMGDSFGDGPPNSDFDLDVLNSADFGRGNPQSHGYQVVGVISGKHNSTLFEKSLRELVTGIYPGKLPIRAVDFQNVDWPTGTNELLKMVNKTGGNIVLNTSMGQKCSIAAGLTQKECVVKYARRWLQKVRGRTAYLAGVPAGLEFTYLHLTSAGNGNGLDAAENSPWTAARLIPGLQNEINLPMANLTNTLVVENRKNTTVLPYKPDCLDPTSDYPGDISAIGTDVWSLTGAAGTGLPGTGAGNDTGTSFSTPQVAGLAAYVWTLKPSLTPQEVLDRLMKTSVTPSTDPVCGGIRPRPVIDAYAAVLAADDTGALALLTGNPFDAPARLAILDVLDSEGLPGGNEAFDHHDLERFIEELETRGGRNPDYSRYDLNGDGYTGDENKKTRFNLNINYPPTYENVNQTIDGQNLVFNENSVSDWEVLCYYAYSPIYTGDEAVRDALLEPHLAKCGAMPDDSAILFTKTIGTSIVDQAIFSMNPSGGDVKMLTNDPAFVGAYGPSFSPDLQKVVYVHGGAGNKDIWVMDRDGSNPTNLTNDLTFPNDPGDTDRDDADPRWSPDGSKIVFSRSRTNGSIGSVGSWIYVMDADGKNRIKLTPDSVTALEGGAIWSPDGNKIAFWSFRDGNYEIYLMDADGSNQTRLTEDAGGQSGFDISPAWSPGGSKIFFRSNRDLNSDNSQNWEIYSMNTDGSGQQNLTNSLEDEEAFVLSPEGSKMACLDSDNQLFIMDVDGANRITVTNGQFFDSSPVWSPESTEIVFARSGDQDDIFIVDESGGNLRNITNNAEGGYPGDWK